MCSLELDRKLYCKSCFFQYSEYDGIPSFTKSDTYFVDSKLTKEEFQKILQSVEVSGWNKTLEYIAEDTNRAAVARNAALRERLKILFALPLGDGGRALDLGCGWGLHSIGLASFFDEVYSLDATLERVRMLSLRAEEQGLDNINPIHASITNHPFPPNSFDFILSNGVLEWMGLNDKNYPPQILQEQFLRNMYVLLKSGGTLAIGIENRYAYGFLSGGVDNHSHMRFTSIVPRRIATLLSMRKKGVPYQTYTYSLQGYRKILNKLGFATSFLAPFPGYNLPAFICDANDESIYNAFVEFAGSHEKSRLRIPAILLQKLNILKYLMPSYYIIAQKTNSSINRTKYYKSWLGGLIQHLGKGRPKSFMFAKSSESSPHYLGIIRFENGEQSVFKVAAHPMFNPQIDKTISFHQSCKNYDSVTEIPQLIDHGTIMGFNFYVQEYINGTKITLSKDNYHRVFELIKHLTNCSGSSNSKSTNLERESSDSIPKPLLERLQNIGFFDYVESVSSRTPTVIQHGDLFHGNIMKMKDNLIVLDWERGTTHGFPLVDFVSFSFGFFQSNTPDWRHKVAYDLFFERTNSMYEHRINKLAEQCGIEESEICWFEMINFLQQVIYHHKLYRINSDLGFLVQPSAKIRDYLRILKEFCLRIE